MADRDRIWAAAAAWLAGVSALLCDHFEASLPFIIGARALFAVAACGTIFLVLMGKARELAGTSQAQLYQFARRVSRWVYILLYGLAITRVSLYLYDVSHCAGCKTANAIVPVRSLDDFQFYVICCVASLWVVRAWVLAPVVDLQNH